MGLMHKLMGFFGLVGEEEVQRSRTKEYEGEEWLEEAEPYYHPSAFTRDTGNQGFTNNVVSLKAVKQKNKLILVEPRTYEETQDLADHLRSRRMVILNLQRLQHEQAKRVVDFLSGTVYAIGGEIHKVGPNIFVCTAENIEVQGNITDMRQTDFENRMR